MPRVIFRCRLTSVVLPSLVMASLFLSSPSSADELEKSGNVAISFERLSGFSSLNYMREQEPDDVDATFSVFGLGWRGASSTDPNVLSPFEAPRLSVDVFVTDGLSVGGTLGIASWANTDEEVDTSLSMFILTARVGYAIAFSDAFGMWPRGGLDYYTWTAEAAGQRADADGFGLTLEAPVFWTPTDPVAFTLGPSFDITFLGDLEIGTEDLSQNYRSIGVQLGLVVWL